jgi:CDP-diacylglycerol---serine O-phosphatidyltransferase
MIKQIPNFFTLLNLILGCMAIVCVLQTPNLEIHQEYMDTIVVQNLPESIEWGCIFIFIAAIVDFLDGFVARLLKATSPMGAQLDSLSDVVSFG